MINKNGRLNQFSVAVLLFSSKRYILFFTGKEGEKSPSFRWGMNHP